MKEYQALWAQARDRLASAVTAMGFPAEWAEVIARQLQSPKAIDRMTAYVRQARPRTEEMSIRSRRSAGSITPCTLSIR